MLFSILILSFIGLLVLFLLIGRLMIHAGRLKALEFKIAKLALMERRIADLEQQLEAEKSGDGKAQGLAIQPLAEQSIPPSAGASDAIPATRTVSTSEGQTPAAPDRPSRPSRTREEWEELVGGKLLNRIGALALTIGLGLFLKYAFESNWISETVRVLIGAFIGFVCLAGGYRTNRSGFQIFAQGLVGAGIAILYLSVYASFNFYSLVPQWAAFVLMALVTVLAFINALYYDSQAEAILGWIGGFLTPILLSTGTANEVGLFTYIVLLDVGLIAMMMRKTDWSVLEPLTLLGTWLMYQQWYASYSIDANLPVTVVFVTLFWILFLALDVVRSRSAESALPLNQIVSGLNSVFYAVALYFLIDNDHHAWMGLVTAAIGSVYALILAGRLQNGELDGGTKARYGLTALAFAVIATAFQFSDFDLVMAWSVEAAALMWFNRQWNLRHIETSAILLFILAALKLCLGTETAFVFAPIREFIPVLNHRAAAFGVLAAALWSGSRSIPSPVTSVQRQTTDGLHYGWALVVMLLLTVETNDFFRWKRIDQPEAVMMQLDYFLILSVTIIWALSSLPLTWIGLRSNVRPAVNVGLACIALAVVIGAVRGIAYAPIDRFTIVMNFRAMALLILTAALIVHSAFLQRHQDAYDWLGDALLVVRIGVILVVFILLTGETRDFFQKDIAILSRQNGLSASHGSLYHFLNLQQMSLSGMWLLYSAVLMGLGLWGKYRELRLAAITVFGFSILKIFIYDLSFLETVYRIFSFIALGVILLAVSYAYQKYRDVILGKA